MLIKTKMGLEKLFYIVFILTPCALAINYSIKYLINWHFKLYILPATLFIILLLYSVSFFFSLKIQIDTKKEIYTVCVLVLLAFLFRYLIIDYIDAAPASDFLIAYENARHWAVRGYSYIERYRDYPYWGMYAYLMNLIFRITGDTSLRTAQMINVCIDTSVVALIYGITRAGLKEIKEKIPYRKIAFMSAMIYSLLPGIATYTGVLTNEYTAVLGACFSVLMFMIAYNRNKNNKNKFKTCLIYICAGGGLGFSNLFKPIAAIIIIAWLIGILFCEIFPLIVKKELNKKKIFYYIAVMILVITSQTLTNEGGLYWLSHIMGIQKQELRTWEMWPKLYCGLNVEDNGKLGPHVRSLKESLELQYSGDELRDVWKEMALENIKENYKQFPALFLIKFQETWANERALIAHGWRRSADLDEERTEYYDNIMDYNKRPLYNIHTLCYIVLLSLCMFGGIRCIRKQNNLVMFICALTVFGFMIVELLIEAQGRYKSVIYWALAVLAGLGAYEISVMIKYISIYIQRGKGKVYMVIKSMLNKKANNFQ